MQTTDTTEHHMLVPRITQIDFYFCTGPNKEPAWRFEEVKVHQHLVVVASEQPELDKLLAKKSICAQYQGG